MLLTVTGGEARAACSTPTGAAGEQFYSSTYNTMQYCNGTVWVPMGTAGITETDPKVGTLTNTKWCTTDGTVINCTENAPSSSLPSLTDALIWVGNGSNVATAVALSGDATISNAGALSLAADAVGNTEMADDAVGVAELSATGTADNTTFLRGDNSWAAPGGGGAGTAGSSAVWTASRTAGVALVSSGYSWTTIPGMSVSFTLARAAKVVVTASGEVRASGGFSHPGLRYNVNGVGQGDPTWGSRIVQTHGSYNLLWGAWSFTEVYSLAAGAHTISTQVQPYASPSGGRICAEHDGTLPGYTGCDMVIQAHYE